MIELGVKQKLYIDHKLILECIFLILQREMEKVIVFYFRKSRFPQNAKIGDEVEVFVYRDSKDREIATTNMPKLQLGELAVLEVAQVNNIGGFMYWVWRKIFFFHIVNRL